MKKFLKEIIFHYKKVEELEKEIETQDKQYEELLIKKFHLDEKVRKLREENKLLRETGEKYWNKSRELRKELKKIKGENNGRK